MKKSNLLLIVTFAVLLGITLMYLLPSSERESTYSIENIAVKFDSASIKKIEIKKNEAGKSVTLENIDGKWKLTSPVNALADNAAVEKILGGAGKFKIANLISSKPEKQQQFQVDSTGTELTLTDKSGKATKLIIGKNGPTYVESYVRLPKSNDVYLAEGFESWSINKEVKDWRDKMIYKTERDSVQEISIQWNIPTDAKKKSTPEQFILSKNNAQWSLNGDSIDNDKVNSMLSYLSNFRTDDFIDSTVVLPEILLSLQLKTKNASANTEEATMLLYPHPSDSTKYWVKNSSDNQLYQITKWMAQNIMKKRSDFIEEKKK